MAVLIETLEYEVEFEPFDINRYWKVRHTICLECPADPIRECIEWELVEVFDDTS